MRRRRVLFAVLVAACVAGAVAYVAAAVGKSAAPPRVAVPAASPGTVKQAVLRRRVSAGALAARLAHDRVIVFRDLDQEDRQRFGDLAVAHRETRNEPRLVAPLNCTRLYFAKGRGLCLSIGGGFGTLYSARILDANLETRHVVRVAGLPSRARISRDGRYGAVTTFVTGHSYASPGSFSTQTLLIDMASGKVVANLERFTITRAGKAIDAPDFNFWGVTFARNSNRFYATLATGGRTYLIEGDVASRRAHVLHENVECPSLSPDGTRIAYKKLVRVLSSRARVWRLSVLDLGTMRETQLAETRSVDDQAEWLDKRRVLYGLDEDVWVVPADGSGRPRRFLTWADSPAVTS